MRISLNGLIRLSIAELISTPMTHLVSGVDVEDGPKLSTCGTATSISGYTDRGRRLRRGPGKES